MFECSQYISERSKHVSYLRKGDRLAASSSPPSRERFFPCYSPRGCTLVSDPVNCGKAIRGVVIPASSSNTGCKLSAVNTFNPRCCGLVHDARIRVIKMVHRDLHVDLLQRIKYKGLKFDNFALIFCPGGCVFEIVSSSLNWKTYKGAERNSKIILHVLPRVHSFYNSIFPVNHAVSSSVYPFFLLSTLLDLCTQ